MATNRTTGLTYEDWAKLPDDNVRRELIDGELVVAPPPSIGHQRAVREVTVAFAIYCREHGGEVFPAPTGVFLSDTNVVEPDVLYVGAANVGRVEQPFVRGAPDIVIEVSSPSTRRYDLVRKREVYERFAVPEYWFVDLESDRIEIYRLERGRFPAPELRFRGETVTSDLAPGLEVSVDEVLGEPSDDDA